jgi:predicted Zn finger-like uncharacterized protein
LTVACGSCGARLAVPDGQDGKLCRCGRCGAVFAAPVREAPVPAGHSPATPVVVTTRRSPPTTLHEAAAFPALTQVNCWSDVMVRWILIPVAVATCLLAGLAGAIAGMCAVLHWPLSEENFAYATRWGVVAGLLGALPAAGLLLSARRDRLWWLAILVVSFTLLMSCAGMWCNVVSSLG